MAHSFPTRRSSDLDVDVLLEIGQQDRADTIKGKVPARVEKIMNRQFAQPAGA